MLAGCQPARLAPERIGPPPPPGTPVVKHAVDGLLVGHRLMAAGEYQLALDAYYRSALQHGLSADVLSAIGSADLKLRRLPEAERALRAALRLDETFVPALNNLGVVLMNENRYPEAMELFKRAFALDSGQSDLIRRNLRLALAMMDKTSYPSTGQKPQFSLMRRGNGEYILLPTKRG